MLRKAAQVSLTKASSVKGKEITNKVQDWKSDVSGRMRKEIGPE